MYFKSFYIILINIIIYLYLIMKKLKNIFCYFIKLFFFFTVMKKCKNIFCYFIKLFFFFFSVIKQIKNIFCYFIKLFFFFFFFFLQWPLKNNVFGFSFHL